MIKKYESKIVKYEYMTKSVVRITLMINEDFNFKAGQYITIVFNHNGQKISRMYSIASTSKDKRNLELCIKLIDGGAASHFIKNLKLGDDIFFIGPAGKFILDKDSYDKDIFFISTGTGIAPFISMTHELIDNNFKNNLVFLNGYRDEDDALYEKELSIFSKKLSNFKTFNILSKPINKSNLYKGHIQDFLSTIILKSQIENSRFYICGLIDMIESVTEKLKEYGVNENQIFIEKYD